MNQSLRNPSCKQLQQRNQNLRILREFKRIKDIYEKNNNEESIKELVAGQCANFLSEMASKETFNSERNLKEQISELDLLDYVKKYTGDIGISVTEITLNSLELTDDSIVKIKEYNKRLK